MLDLLTVLGRNDAEASDMMNDILAQVSWSHLMTMNTFIIVSLEFPGRD